MTFRKKLKTFNIGHFHYRINYFKLDFWINFLIKSVLFKNHCQKPPKDNDDDFSTPKKIKKTLNFVHFHYTI